MQYLQKECDFPTIDAFIEYIVPLLKTSGTKVTISRKNLTGEILELQNVFFRLTDCRFPISMFKALHQDVIWRQLECLTEILAKNPPLMSYYNTPGSKFLEQFELPNKRHNYTYGTRWQANEQLFNVYKTLKADLNSRQAIHVIYRGEDTTTNVWNKSCTILHQYMFRNKSLDLTVYMRSNDLFKGFKYDIYLAAFLLQMMAGWLNIRPGAINYFANSFHVYKDDYSKLNELIAEEKRNYIDSFKFDLNQEQFYSDMLLLEKIEEYSRNKRTAEARDLQQDFKSKEFQQWGANFINYWEKKYFGKLLIGIDRS